jgi:hypothetical protein
VVVVPFNGPAAICGCSYPRPPTACRVLAAAMILPAGQPIRYFADFTKAERLAVRHAFRGTLQSFDAARAATKISGVKGGSRIPGQAGRTGGWKHDLALVSRRHLVLSDSFIAEWRPDIGPLGEALQHQSNPKGGARPERKCHRPGGLELWLAPDDPNRSMQ